MTAVRAALWLAALVPACFHPSYENVACGPEDTCPDGLTCNQLSGRCEPPGAGPVADAAVGDGAAVPDGQGSTDGAQPGDARVCFGAGLNVCLAAPPTQALTLSAAINTDAAATCTRVLPQPGSPTSAPELCAIAGTTVVVSGTVMVTGSRALVVIGSDSVTVMGTLDASSTTGSNPRRRGAAGNLGACPVPTAADSSTGGGGGGAGGSLSTKGGNGGRGNLNATGSPPVASNGGVAGAALSAAPAVLRGGCPGGSGGSGQLGTAGPAGGDGGGALYLIAGSSIAINGDVFASGGGGGATPSTMGVEQGGGGGGTGGMIGLDAPSIMVTGRVVANGGAGGGGGGLSTGGNAGGDGTTTNWSARAAAGNPGTGGAGALGTGGPGTAAGQITGIDGATADGGAGGGGGGLGIVVVYGALSGGAMVSPPPTLH